MDQLIASLIDEVNRDYWETQRKKQVKAYMSAFDGFVGMMKETFEAEARRRAGGDDVGSHV